MTARICFQQIRGGQPGGQSQGQYLRDSGLLQEDRRRPAARHRDRSQPVGTDVGDSRDFFYPVELRRSELPNSACHRWSSSSPLPPERDGRARWPCGQRRWALHQWSVAPSLAHSQPCPPALGRHLGRQEGRGCARRTARVTQNTQAPSTVSSPNTASIPGECIWKRKEAP